MFSMRIQLWKAVFIIISFFLTGLCISMAILFLTCKKIFRKNKISESANFELTADNQKIDEEIILENLPPVNVNEANNENLLDHNDTSVSQSESAIDYSKVKSKYWELLNQRKDAKFKNFLHKSKKPFLGYNSTAIQERKNSFFDESKRMNNEKF